MPEEADYQLPPTHEMQCGEMGVARLLNQPKAF